MSLWNVWLLLKKSSLFLSKIKELCRRQSMFSLLDALETYVNHYHFLISEDHRSITWFSAFQKMNKTIYSAPARRSFTLESGFHPDKTTAYIKLKSLNLKHHFSTRLNFRLWSEIVSWKKEVFESQWLLCRSISPRTSRTET